MNNALRKLDDTELFGKRIKLICVSIYYYLVLLTSIAILCAFNTNCSIYRATEDQRQGRDHEAVVVLPNVDQCLVRLLADLAQDRLFVVHVLEVLEVSPVVQGGLHRHQDLDHHDKNVGLTKIISFIQSNKRRRYVHEYNYSTYSRKRKCDKFINFKNNHYWCGTNVMLNQKCS